ncbi:MAG: hypothetical protein ABIN94_20630 [Ferruginibacter sp.]
MYSNEFFTGWVLLIIFLLFILVMIPTVFYLLTLQRALEAVSIENRRMAPGQVWLSLIPVFNLVWMFIVVNRIAESFNAECALLNIPTAEQNPTQGIGTTKNILSLCTLIPIIGILAGIAYLVCWIMHWIKVSEYKNLILANKDNIILEAEKGIFHH